MCLIQTRAIREKVGNITYPSPDLQWHGRRFFCNPILVAIAEFHVYSTVVSMYSPPSFIQGFRSQIPICPIALQHRRYCREGFAPRSRLHTPRSDDVVFRYQSRDSAAVLEPDTDQRLLPKVPVPVSPVSMEAYASMLPARPGRLLQLLYPIRVLSKEWIRACVASVARGGNVGLMEV